MQFYVLQLKVGVPNETWLDIMEPSHAGDCSHCPACGTVVTSLPWLPPYRATLRCHGRHLGDVAFFGSTDLAVSERFRRAWEGAHLRGIDAFTPFDRLRVRPARLGRKPVPYFHVAPRLFGTQVDVQHSVIEYQHEITCEKCKGGGTESIRGAKIDEASWTGEDMFHCWGLPGTIIVTDHVRQLRDDYGLTNVNLTPVEEYFVDFYRRWSVIDYSPDEVPTPDDTVPDESSNMN